MSAGPRCERCGKPIARSQIAVVQYAEPRDRVWCFDCWDNDPGALSEAATQAVNAMTLHEKHGVEPHLAVTLAAAGVEPDPRLREELEREVDDA